MGHVRAAISVSAILTFVSGLGSVLPAAAMGTSIQTPGTQLWVGRYQGPTLGGNGVAALAVTSDGKAVFVTGSSQGRLSGLDFATVKYESSTGERLGVMRYNGPDNYADWATSLALSPDDTRLFVAGTSTTASKTFDYTVVVYDSATGDRLGVMRYDNHRHDDFGKAIGLSPDGTTAYVTGQSDSGDGHIDIATVAFDTASGARRWVRRFNVSATGIADATGLAVSPDGTMVFVTGFAEGSTQSNFDYATVAYRAATGVEAWRQIYDDNRDQIDVARAMAVSPDGSTVVVTGEAEPDTSGDLHATIAYDALTGTTRWMADYRSPDTAPIFTSVAVGTDGSTVFVGGTGYLGAAADATVVANDASTGSQRWAHRFTGPGGADAGITSVVPSPDGSALYVAGFVLGSNGEDQFVTMALDAASGARLWTRALPGPGGGPADAVDMATAPDGSVVFVTGRGGESETAVDYITAAYSTG